MWSRVGTFNLNNLFSRWSSKSTLAKDVAARGRGWCLDRSQGARVRRSGRQHRRRAGRVNFRAAGGAFPGVRAGRPRSAARRGSRVAGAAARRSTSPAKADGPDHDLVPRELAS